MRGSGFTVISACFLFFFFLSSDRLSAVRIRPQPPSFCPSVARDSSFQKTRCSGRRHIERSPDRPVLKHGPRSLTCVRAFWFRQTRARNEGDSPTRVGLEAPPGGVVIDVLVPGAAQPADSASPCGGKGSRPQNHRERRDRARARPLGPERW